MKAQWRLILLIAMLAGWSASAAPATVVEGESWNGAKYQLSMPEEWNGDLVVYAHGYVDAAMPIALSTNDQIEAIRDMLLDEGYAVAYSSYSANGFAVREGTVDTLCLNLYFKREFGKPERTFLMGHSLGGLVCVRLAECLPRHYDGVLTIAGMVGGSQVEIDYMTNVRILWEHYYPGVLPGSIEDVPEGVDLLTEVIYPIIGTLSASPNGAIAISTIDQTPIPYINGEELVGSYAYALGFYYRGHADLEARTGTPVFFSNQRTVYTSEVPLVDVDQLNEEVQRFKATKWARRYFRRNYESTGRLRVPMLGIHNSRDPVVPVFHQAVYAEKVAKRGRPDTLVQWSHNRYGHTETFTADEVCDAFAKLVEWVDTGVAPTP